MWSDVPMSVVSAGSTREVLVPAATLGSGRYSSRLLAAIDHALAGRHVVVVTPTASGKTLCYNAPVLQAILRDMTSYL